MKTSWKKAVAVLLTVLMAGALWACGGTSGGDKTPAADTYTVTYDAAGGTLTGKASVSVEKGKSVTLPTATRTGYVLAGWYDGETSVGGAGEAYTPTADSTLTARWTADAAALAAVNKTRAIEYAKKIRELYWDPSTKLSKLSPSGGVPYLWPYTEQVSMVNAVLQVLDKDDPDRAYFATYLEELIEGLRHYRVRNVRVGDGQSWNNASHVLAAFGENDGTANSYAVYNSGRNDDAIDAVDAGMDGIFFDDNIWVAKEFYFAYLNLGQEKYLNEAVNIVNWILGEGYEPTEGLQGIYWKWGAKFMYEGTSSLKDETHASLNACSSAPTAMMLTKLYPVLRDDTHVAKFGALATDYLAKAQNIYEFCYEVLRNPSNECLRDKVFLREGFAALPASQRIQLTDEQILPYNTGTFMTAGAELYTVTTAAGNTAVAKVYAARNKAVAAGADRQFANPQVVQGQYAYNKNSWFTSFILDGFIDIGETGVDTADYIEHMSRALEYGYTHHRNEDGLVCPSWVGGWGEFTETNLNSENHPLQILLQSANAHCYAMLARYYAL